MEEKSERRRAVCLVTSVTFFIEVFLLDQIAALSKIYDVTVIVNSEETDFFSSRGIEATIVQAPIERKIKLWNDLRALRFLIRYFKDKQFDLVHSTTPKAGFLTMLASYVAKVPIRIHTFTGQVWGSRSGLTHRMLKLADKMTAKFATDILVDSFSQRAYIIEQGIVSPAKSIVLANGSISGVDTEKFRAEGGFRAEIRAAYNIKDSSVVFLYMARLTKDKGALLMAQGFARVAARGDTDSHLIMVGPDEEGLRGSICEICAGVKGRVHFADYTRVPQKFMAAADVFCLPSYREGFGTVLINAAAAGIPAVAARIYGSEEAVQENTTGLLHEAGNAVDLAARMEQLASDASLRARLGKNARERARRDFLEANVTAALLKFSEDAMSRFTNCRVRRE